MNLNKVAEKLEHFAQNTGLIRTHRSYLLDMAEKLRKEPDKEQLKALQKELKDFPKMVLWNVAHPDLKNRIREFNKIIKMISN